MKFSDDQINQLREVVRSEVKSELKLELKKSLAPIKRDLKAIRKDLSWTMLKYDTRLIHLEKHTAHPPTQFLA